MLRRGGCTREQWVKRKESLKRVGEMSLRIYNYDEES